MTTSPFSLADKTILVTGASSGIGRATALLCAQQGARVLMLGRNAERLAETLGMTGRPDFHRVLSVDLCDQEALEALLPGVLLSPLSGMVHCAGISTTLPFRMVREQHLQQFFETNVFAALHLTRRLLKPALFSEAGGSVVFLSSVMGLTGSPGKTLYGMTKGALLSATRSLALEYAPRKIRFNCISPGVVATPMSAAAVYSRDEQALAEIRARHPLGLGEADDVAAACVYLLSDAARWITGSNLVVDGGYTSQ